MTYKFVEPLMNALKKEWPESIVYLDDSSGLSSRFLYIRLDNQSVDLLIISYSLVEDTFFANKVIIEPETDINKILSKISRNNRENQQEQKQFRCLEDKLYVETRESNSIKDYLSQTMSGDELLSYLIDAYKLTA